MQFPLTEDSHKIVNTYNTIKSPTRYYLRSIIYVASTVNIYKILTLLKIIKLYLNEKSFERSVLFVLEANFNSI